MDDLTPGFRSLLMGAFGVLLLVRGLQIRLGHSRGWLRMNQASSLPLFTRNAPFMLIPGGILFVVGATLAALPESQDWVGLKVILGVALMVMLPWLLVVSSRPPRWLMPRWFRDELGGAGLPPDRFDQAVLVVSIVVAFFLLSVFLSIALAGRG